jgi:hypothetical protein
VRRSGSSTTLILLFAKKFFHAVRTRGGTNEVERANILAPGLRRLTSSRTPSSRLHPRTLRGLAFVGRFCETPQGSRIQLQQRNCSRFTRDFLRRSTDQPRIFSGLNSQRTNAAEVAACASAFKIYFPTHDLRVSRSGGFQAADVFRGRSEQPVFTHRQKTRPSSSDRAVMTSQQIGGLETAAPWLLLALAFPRIIYLTHFLDRACI